MGQHDQRNVARLVDRKGYRQAAVLEKEGAFLKVQHSSGAPQGVETQKERKVNGRDMHTQLVPAPADRCREDRELPAAVANAVSTTEI